MKALLRYPGRPSAALRAAGLALLLGLALAGAELRAAQPARPPAAPAAVAAQAHAAPVAARVPGWLRDALGNRVRMIQVASVCMVIGIMFLMFGKIK